MLVTTQRRQAKTALAALSFLLLVTFAQVPVCRAHRGLGVNICARDERPVSAASKRLSCKQDPLCVHETQCGCIPKDCTCGDEHCIFAGPVSGGDADAGKGEGEGERHSHAAGDSDDAAAQAVGLGATGSGHGASKHHLVDDDSDGPSHTHADGTAHGHPGGDMPHHHDKDGAIVFDLPKKPAKLVMNKGKLLLKPAAVASKVQAAVAAEDGGDAVDADAVHDRPARAPATGGAAQSGTADAKPESASAAAAGTSAATGARADEGSAPPVNGTGTQDSLPTREIHQVRPLPLSTFYLHTLHLSPPHGSTSRAREFPGTWAHLCTWVHAHVRALKQRDIWGDAEAGGSAGAGVGAGDTGTHDRRVLHVFRVRGHPLLQAQGAGQEHAFQGHVQ